MKPQRKHIGESAALGALVGLITGLASRWLWWPEEAGLGLVLACGALGLVAGLALGIWRR